MILVSVRIYRYREPLQILLVRNCLSRSKIESSDSRGSHRTPEACLATQIRVWVRNQRAEEVAYWNMCNDFPESDLLALRLESSTYASAERHGVLRFSQTHDEARTFAVARGSHYEEDAIGQLTRKHYLRLF